ncbi:MAG: TonB-dependent receptor [Sphingobacteriaceae bacterium]|nr:TonB-dependent receptor [Sphingobacteriaceae bacterium]
MKLITYLFIALCCIQISKAQNAKLTGTIKDAASQEIIVGAIVSLEGTKLSTTTNNEGKFSIGGIVPKTYNIKIQLLGYTSKTLYNVVVNNGNAVVMDVELDKATNTLQEVKIKSNSFGKKLETPLSVQNLTIEEIKSNPGGNFDISRVIQALPGVAGTTGAGGFRNDIIIRGGAPNENVYYLDGVEIPQINHFSTQGSAGGPQGILNVSFIQDVTLSSSSFAAKFDNALSSVLEFKQRNGNPNAFQSNIRLSSSEAALTIEGPLSKKTTYLASARRSYLQYLFQAIDLPIRPNYWDFQYKVKHDFDKNNSLNLIGVGAIDEFTFSTPKKSTPDKEYALRSSPSINQWNYTVGANFKHLFSGGYWQAVLSQNMFSNQLERFADNNKPVAEERTLLSNSKERETKLRVESKHLLDGFTLNYGVSVQQVAYSNDFDGIVGNRITGNVLTPIRSVFNTDINFVKYGLFVSGSARFLNEKLSTTFGLRADDNTFMSGAHLLKTLSPRLGLSYSLFNGFNLNASVGRYSKIPIYTILGYKQGADFVNKNTDYTMSNHYVTGVEYNPTSALRFTAEGFYKTYENYAVSERDGLSLANQGGDFGAIGNEKVSTNGKGRSYGVELFAQQKLVKNTFVTASYTFYVSQFSGLDGKYVASAWDNRHLVSIILGQKLGRGWELGLKYRMAGGAPYTPFVTPEDSATAKAFYMQSGKGQPDFAQLNNRRLGAFNQVDMRIDKKWNFNKSSFNLYFDFTNVLQTVNPETPRYSFKRNEENTAFVTTDGNPLRADGANGTPFIFTDATASFIPQFGFIWEF